MIGRAVIASTLLASCVALGACAASATTQKVDLGGGAWSMTKRSNFFTQKTAVLKEQVEQEALADCAARGMALAVLDSRAIDADPPAFPSAVVQYRCVAR